MTNEERAIDDAGPFESDDATNALAGRLDRLWASGVLDASGSQSQKMVGKYQLQQVVGAGAFGIVYLARDTELGKAVALKLPRLEVLLDVQKRKRFADEAVMAARLDHPQIVRVYEARLNGPDPYIASAFCDGPNLAEWMAEREQPSPWEAIANLMAEVADAVQHAHSQGVLHRDLKPANILLVADEVPSGNKSDGQSGVDFPFSPRLTDFGLAKFSDMREADTRSSQMIGTPLYMAPERLEGCEATVAADVYSLGVILFELLSGALPIEGESYLELVGKIRHQPPRRLRSLRRDVPKDLDRICAKCLSKEPDARYQTTADLAKDLRRCVNGLQIQGQLPTWRDRIAYWCTRPERVPNAGWFGIVSHLVLIAWVASAVMLIPTRFDLEQIQWSKQIYQMLYGVCFGFGPVILISWLVVQRYRWAVYVALLLTLGKIPFQFRAMVYKPVYFSDLYETGGVYVFMDHFIIAVLLLFQLFFLGCAVLADRKHRVCR